MKTSKVEKATGKTDTARAVLCYCKILPAKQREAGAVGTALQHVNVVVHGLIPECQCWHLACIKCVQGWPHCLRRDKSESWAMGIMMCLGEFSREEKVL